MPENAVQDPGAPATPLEQWVYRLSEEEMPIFAQTVGEINRILAKEEYSSLALARVILQDPSMTAKVLKLANSAFYNPGSTSISTISRATVVLGFNAVQSICITIAIIESLVKGRAKDRVMRELARAIHAASQARQLALAQKDQASEEIFIAALLLNLGQMAFWCFAGDDGDRLDKALQADPRREQAEVEREILGFKLSNLTSALAEEWKLTTLVQEALKGQTSRDPRGRWIDLGHQIARESEAGWTSPGMRKVAAEAAKVLGKHPNEVGPALESCAAEAVATAKAMGATVAARLIPVPGGVESESLFDGGELVAWANPDPMLQLKILRDITSIMMSKPDLNVILEMVLEGIHRGVGMDRTVLALVAPGRGMVKAKHVLAPDRLRLLDRFWFEMGPKVPRNIFTAMMEGQDAVWISDYADPKSAPLLNGPVIEVVGRAQFFACPVIYSSQTIGLFYADRHPSGRGIDVEAFESFKLFVHQANLGLEHVARLRMAALQGR